MKIVCTQEQKAQLCCGANLCMFISKNKRCKEKDNCAKCVEENIEWEVLPNDAKSDIEQDYSCEDIVKAIQSCYSEGDCQECPLYPRTNCIEIKNRYASSYIMQILDKEQNEPLNLTELIIMMREKKPVWIIGYGWYFIEEIVSDQSKTMIRTEHNSFVYSDDRFYRYEVK